MAVASAHQPPPVQQLTPPSSSHGGRGSWDYAVPLADMKSGYIDQNLSMSENDPPHFSNRPYGSNANGTYNYSRSNTLDSHKRHYDHDARYTATPDGDGLQRKRSDITASGSEPENAADYHKSDRMNGTKRASSQRRDKKRKQAASIELDEVEKEDAYWIHRDKLKEIETRELEEAGFQVGRGSRSNSRSRSATRNRSRKNSEATHGHEDDRANRRHVSPIPDEEVVSEEPVMWDLRTPEEIAADREAWAARNTQIPRPGTSRIPVAKISPAPVPSTFVERDAPLPRSRRGSGAHWGEDIATQGARVRSSSVSSQDLLNEVDKRLGEQLKSSAQASKPVTPAQASPKKAKPPTKMTPASGGRKTATPRSGSQAKPRNTNNSSARRPGTSSGSLSRPTTAHRPEGEAPWIATMYKPDPRLPPDQQIIPTHAKRMQQQQWESEGKPGTIYDREFRPLNTADSFVNKRASQIQPVDIEKPKDPHDWPLPSPTKAAPEQADRIVKSPTNEAGNYKLTPTIPPQQSPRAPSRAASQASARQGNTTKIEAVRQPEPMDDAEKTEKKGCCCIVM